MEMKIPYIIVIFKNIFITNVYGIILSHEGNSDASIFGGMA
jgi:hypothetical protein